MGFVDLVELSSKVKNFNDYIAITQDLTTKYRTENVELNMSAIIFFKKMRSLEIEYFNKYHDCGAAFRIFERILWEPPSWDWNILGKGLVDLILYWLDAVRHHLIDHHIHWWLFLEQLLRFSKVIVTKAKELVDIVTEELAESFLDLATNNKTSLEQCHKIMSTFNVCCSDSSREVRSRVKSRLDNFFTKVAHMVAASGHFPCQYSVMECLLRFMVARQDRLVRATTAKTWFPFNLYRQEAVVVFLKRPWKNFLLDARDFLNAQNAGGELISSVLCDHLAVGDDILITTKDKLSQWLDFNIGSKCLTAFLVNVDQQIQRFNWLIITCESVARVTLRRDTDLTILIATKSRPQLYPTIPEFQDTTEVTIRVSVTDFEKVKKGLTGVFGDKYQYSHEASKSTCSQSEKRYRKSGCVPKSCDTPSSVSTTSLAQLHAKLEALPPYSFDAKSAKRQPVILPPDLSCVTEMSETDEIQNSLGSAGTFKVRPNRIGQASMRCYKESSKAFSDDNTNATVKSARVNRQESQSDNDSMKKTAKIPKCFKGRGMSSLLEVMVKSTDTNLLNTSLERVPKDKDLSTDDLREMLVQEALRDGEEHNKVVDSGIDSAEKRSQEALADSSLVIENTALQDLESIKHTSKTSSVENRRQEIQQKTNANLKESTSDESNTSVINETPLNYVNTKRGNLTRQKSSPNVPSATRTKDNQPVDDKDYCQNAAPFEDFFSQNLGQRSVYISPTRARKINETSSESDDELDACLVSNNDLNVNIEQFHHDVEVMECLTNMIDKVCCDLEMNSQNLILDMEKAISPKSANIIQALENITNIGKQKNKKGKGKKGKPKKQLFKIKIKGHNDKDEKTSKAKKNKLQLEFAKQSPVTVSRDEVLDDSVNKNKSLERKEHDPSLVRRKRKLYSPQDDKNFSPSDEHDDESPKVILQTRKSERELESEDDQPLIQIKTKNTLKSRKSQSKASCYIEIENDRMKFQARTRATRSRCRMSSLSPKSKTRNDVFDSLKNNMEGLEKITLINKQSDKDLAVYNFTSDSEDEDFKKKKAELQKRHNITPAVSEDSLVSTRRGKGKKKKQPVSSSESGNIPAKPVKRRAVRGRKTKIDRVLEDERMRDVPNEELNTSLVLDQPQPNTIRDLEPKIILPEPEMMVEDLGVKSKVTGKTEVKKPARKKDVIKTDKIERAKIPKPQASKSKIPKLDVVRDEDERTLSPLPALEVETVNPEIRDGENSTVTSNLLQKITKMYQNQETANDSNTTQNLLSENDRVDSPSDLRAVLNITDEIDRHLDEEVNNEMILAGDSIIGKQLKSRRYSDISDAENENLNKLKDVPKSNEISSGSSAKKKTLSLKKKTCTGLRESVVQPKNNESKTVSVKLKKKEIADLNTADVPMVRQSLKPKSSVEDEIITIPDYTDAPSHVTSRRHSLKRKYKRFSTDTINLVSETGDDSGESIATQGITGHGDSSEQPPMFQALDEKFSPRELEDMEPDLKEYSKTLDKALHGFNDNPIKTATEKIRSLRVAIDRISSEDISKHSDATSDDDNNWCDDIRRYLPSRRESLSSTEKGSCRTKQNVRSQFMPIKDALAEKESSSGNDDTKTNVAEACNKRKSLISPLIVLEDMPKRKVRPETSDEENKRYNTRQNDSSSPKNQRTRLSKKITSKTAPKAESNTDSTEINKSIKRIELSKDISGKSIRAASITSLDSTENVGTSKSAATATKNKTTVGKYLNPDDVSGKTTTRSDKTPASSKNRESVHKTLPKPVAGKEALKSPKTLLNTETRTPTKVYIYPVSMLMPVETPKDSRKHLKTPALSPESREIIKKLMGRSSLSPQSKSIKSKISASTSIKAVKPKTPLKRSARDVGVSEVSPKRPKMIPRVVIPAVSLDSVPSVSSVNEWVKEAEISGKVISEADALNEIFSNFTEKLETTLAEIHQNSGRNLSRLFVEAQKRLTVMKTERDKTKKKLNEINEMMTKIHEMTRIIMENEDKNIEEQDTFMTWLKQSAAQVLREDMKHKQAMVVLLKEDAQAVLDHRAKTSKH